MAGIRAATASNPAFTSPVAGMSLSKALMLLLLCVNVYADPCFYQRFSASNTARTGRRAMLTCFCIWVAFDAVTNIAGMKAQKVVRLAEYILGNELLTAAQASGLRQHQELKSSEVTTKVVAAVREKAPFMENDHYIHPDMEWARQLVHDGRVREIAEQKIGKMF